MAKPQKSIISSKHRPTNSIICSKPSSTNSIICSWPGPKNSIICSKPSLTNPIISSGPRQREFHYLFFWARLKKFHHLFWAIQTIPFFILVVLDYPDNSMIFAGPFRQFHYLFWPGLENFGPIPKSTISLKYTIYNVKKIPIYVLSKGQKIPLSGVRPQKRRGGNIYVDFFLVCFTVLYNTNFMNKV